MSKKCKLLNQLSGYYLEDFLLDSPLEYFTVSRLLNEKERKQLLKKMQDRVKVLS